MVHVTVLHFGHLGGALMEWIRSLTITHASAPVRPTAAIELVAGGRRLVVGGVEPPSNKVVLGRWVRCSGKTSLFYRSMRRLGTTCIVRFRREVSTPSLGIKRRGLRRSVVRWRDRGRIQHRFPGWILHVCLGVPFLPCRRGIPAGVIVGDLLVALGSLEISDHPKVGLSS